MENSKNIENRVEEKDKEEVLSTTTLEDDGSLSFLGIGDNPEDNFFHCDMVRAKTLVDKMFWILDYKEGIVTSKGEDRIVIKCKYNLEDGEEDAFKFITSSKNLLWAVSEVRRRDAFPRRVTLKRIDNTYRFI